MVTWALKEWDVAVTALLRGQTVLLLRKGGIRERTGQFTLQSRQVLLLPTFEHQDPALLQPDYRALVQSGPTPPQEGTVSFTGWAEITQVLALPSETSVLALLPELIWNQRFVQERWQWQPHRPLYALLLRAYRFDQPRLLPWHPGYGGCRSWVEVEPSVPLHRSQPALDETQYQQRVDRILATLPD